MNIALIVAGGVGARMHREVPKQFLNIYDKPIIIYTLENFETSPLIDEIVVVCVDGWQEELKRLAELYGITKLKRIVTGGATVQESIRNGVNDIYERFDGNDNVIIHDGIRPMLDESVLNDVIEKCDLYGNAVTSLPYNEQIFLVNNEISTKHYVPREKLRRVSTPQAYKLNKLHECYERAFSEEIGIYGSSYTNTMMADLGETLYFAKGSEKNIKLTTPDDLEIFKALLELKDNA